MNRLPATIAAVEVHGSIALVDATVGDHRFAATLVGVGNEARTWSAGMAVSLLFKETEVSLGKNLSGLISLRNRIPATISDIEHGKLLTKVTLAFGVHSIESIITTRSARALTLAVGDQVEGLVKANEMTVLTKDIA